MTAAVERKTDHGIQMPKMSEIRHGMGRARESSHVLLQYVQTRHSYGVAKEDPKSRENICGDRRRLSSDSQERTRRARLHLRCCASQGRNETMQTLAIIGQVARIRTAILWATSVGVRVSVQP